MLPQQACFSHFSKNVPTSAVLPSSSGRTIQMSTFLLPLMVPFSPVYGTVHSTTLKFVYFYIILCKNVAKIVLLCLISELGLAG